MRETWLSLLTRPVERFGPTGAPKHDILFNAAKGVVVPPGVVDKILDHITPLMQYDRKGGLYVAGMTASDFHRPGAIA